MQVLPLPRRISFAASRDSLPSRVLTAHSDEEVWADGFPHPESFIHMPLMSPRERPDSHASVSSLASRWEASRGTPQQPGHPPAAAGPSSPNLPHSRPGTESSGTPGWSSSIPEPHSSASGASSGVAADRQPDPEGSASDGTSQRGGAGPLPTSDSEGGGEAGTDIDSVLKGIGEPPAQLCLTTYMPKDNLCQICVQPFGWGSRGCLWEAPWQLQASERTSLDPGRPSARYVTGTRHWSHTPPVPHKRSCACSESGGGREPAAVPHPVGDEPAVSGVGRQPGARAALQGRVRAGLAERGCQLPAGPVARRDDGRQLQRRRPPHPCAFSARLRSTTDRPACSRTSVKLLPRLQSPPEADD